MSALKPWLRSSASPTATNITKSSCRRSNSFIRQFRNSDDPEVRLHLLPHGLPHRRRVRKLIGRQELPHVEIEGPVGANIKSRSDLGELAFVHSSPGKWPNQLFRVPANPRKFPLSLPRPPFGFQVCPACHGWSGTPAC